METVKKILDSLYQQKELKKQAEIREQKERAAFLQREKEEQARRQQQYEALLSTVQAEQKPIQLHNLQQEIMLQQQSQFQKLGIQAQPPPSAPQLENTVPPENLYNQQVSPPEQMQAYTPYAHYQQPDQDNATPAQMGSEENPQPPKPTGIMDAFTPLLDPQQEAIRQQLLEQQQLLLKQSQTIPTLPSVEPSAPLLPGLDEPISAPSSVPVTLLLVLANLSSQLI